MTHESRSRSSHLQRRSSFESEPADEWREEYARGGPVRSNEPERDWFFEHNIAPNAHRPASAAANEPTRGSVHQRSYRGVGPKGYRPSDERIREIVCERLTDDPNIDASELLVEVRDGRVCLSGLVPSSEMRRAAEELAERVRGVHDVVNTLRVLAGRQRH